ncbi:hypothetical protein MMC24_006258, partial [Lignoscripta atroalba]|nr:hypothetical protein [Lignoscripta atroalba]
MSPHTPLTHASSSSSSSSSSIGMSSAQLQSLKEVIDSQLQILKDAIDSQFDEQTKQQLTPAKPKTDVKNMLTTTMLMAPKTFARPNVVIEKQYQLVQQLRDELAEQSS